MAELSKLSNVPSYQTWKKARAGDLSERIKVLSFNIKLDGELGLEGVIDLIRNSDADLVGLQESQINAAKIAQALGFNYVQNGYSTLLTRFNIEQITPGGNGIVVQTDSGQKLAFFEKHMNHAPYQPYQLLGIPYENGAFIKTEAEAVSEAKKARGADLENLKEDINSIKDKGLPTLVLGDFNEPSHLDWTEAAAKAGRHPIKVEWPTSKALADEGFTDAYRKTHPDEMSYPGFTWTPMSKTTDKNDHHDRIDFIYYRGDGLKLNSAQIIGESQDSADIVVHPYPSDHRAVLAEFELSRS